MTTHRLVRDSKREIVMTYDMKSVCISHNEIDKILLFLKLIKFLKIS